MFHRILITGLWLSMLALVNTIGAAEEDAAANANDSKRAQEAKVILEKIKSLSGDWIHTKGEQKGQVALSVRVIAGGSAVVQREFPGSPMEMITVYHLDGDDVMLNHYCMLGNQPRMKVTMGEQKDTLVFNFVEATNLTSKNDAHMHHGKLTLVDNDLIRPTWTMFVDGKAAEAHSFEMTRRKQERKSDESR